MDSMFLAINELIKEKTRYVLIIFVILLVSYLTFFLTALAYGLANSYTQGIEKWQASGIVMQKDANDNIARSLLNESDYTGIIDDNSAVLGVGNATVELDKKDDVALFGVDVNSFLMPNITNGRKIENKNEIVVSDQLKQIGVNLNQEIVFKGSDQKYKVVGFTDNATFQTAPIVYLELDSWRHLASDLAGMIGMKDNSTVNAIITKNTTDNSKYNTEKMSWQPISDYYFKLPGYSAQVLTFSTMIGFLIVIASFVLTIFMYILTLQKKSMFGVLKAEGIPNSYIVRSVNIQIIILTLFGMTIGILLTLISGLFLATKIPFVIQPIFFLAIIGLFLLFSIIGGIASVRAVTKIDPAEAI